jgi:hypothetical protein
VTGLLQDDLGFQFWCRQVARLDLGPAEPPLQRPPGPISLGVKWLGHEADHSSIFHEVKNERSDTSTPTVCLHGVYKDNFMLLYYLLHEST